MLNLLFLLVVLSAAQAAPSDFLKLLNVATQEKTSLTQCPGVKLVATCGNKVCESYKKETAENCPADCVEAPIRSYNHLVICQKVQEIKVPTTVMEVRDIVQEAIYRNMKVKPVGALHSATEVMCSEGVAVPMNEMNQIKGISSINGVKVVEAGPGITIFNLSEWLYERGYTLQGLPNPGFRDVTIAGAMATGSHGSTPYFTGVVSNLVEAIEFIDGAGERQYLERASTPEVYFKSLTANLGLLGIVTSLKFAIEPKFDLEVQVSYHSDRALLENGIFAPVQSCDFGQLNWFPVTGRFMKTCGKKTNKKPDLRANNVLLEPDIPNFIVKPFKQLLQLGACTKGIMCQMEGLRYTSLWLTPPFKNGRKLNTRKVVGPAHRMISSHLTKNQDGLFQTDWEIAVPKSRANDAMKFIKKHFKDNKACLPLVGIFVRYAPSEGRSLLAHTNSSGGDWKEGETAVFFEAPVYYPVGFSPDQMARYEKVYVDFVRELITKYSGRPHWGKNKQWAFDLAKDLGAYGDHLEKFQLAIDRFDPHGTFANKFSENLGIVYQ